MKTNSLRIVLVWLVLLLLLAATLVGAHLPVGAAKPWIGYGIATAKAALILWYFMDMRREGAIARLATLAAAVWLLLMMALMAADYLTRAGL